MCAEGLKAKIANATYEQTKSKKVVRFLGTTEATSHGAFATFLSAERSRLKSHLATSKIYTRFAFVKSAGTLLESTFPLLR